MEFTTIVIVVVLAHCPAFGVKVYVVVAVLFNAGDHVPAIPLVEVVGSALNVPPEQIGVTCVNVGVKGGGCVMVACAVLTHPALSVTVTL